MKEIFVQGIEFSNVLCYMMLFNSLLYSKFFF